MLAGNLRFGQPRGEEQSQIIPFSQHEALQRGFHSLSLTMLKSGLENEGVGFISIKWADRPGPPGMHVLPPGMWSDRLIDIEVPSKYMEQMSLEGVSYNIEFGGYSAKEMVEFDFRNVHSSFPSWVFNI